MALEAGGFTLPEPTYRLRIDQFPDLARAEVTAGTQDADTVAGRTGVRPTRNPDAEMSVRPDVHIDEAIAAERRETSEEDLLSPGRPIE